MKQQFLLSRISWSSSGTRVMHDTLQAAGGDDPIFLEIRGKEGKVPQSREVTTATGVVSGQQKMGVGRERAQDGRAEAAAEGSALLWWKVQGTQGTPTRQSSAQLAPFPGSQAGRWLRRPVPSYCRFQPQSHSLGQHPEKELGSRPVPLLGSPALWRWVFVSFGSSVLASDSMCGLLPVLVLN